LGPTSTTSEAHVDRFVPWSICVSSLAIAIMLCG
jgi:hypothetical protein